MADESVVNSCLNIMRRMPPADIEKNLTGLINLVPGATDEVLQRVDQPLDTQTDPSTGQQFILCDYNREGDSYRSPLSNKFYPPLEDEEDVPFPSDKLRKLEVTANDLFDVYREMYYDGGVSSVYFWDLEDGAFASCWLVKHDVEAKSAALKKGTWNSINVVEVQESGKGTAVYKLTTTVMITMVVNAPETGAVDLSGSLTRQARRELRVDDDSRTHLANMGGMIEAMETTLTRALDELYAGKTAEILSRTRTLRRGPTASREFVASLNDAVRASARRSSGAAEE